MLQWSGSSPYKGRVICDHCTIRFIRNVGCCVRWSPTKGSNRYTSSAVGVRGFGLRTGYQLCFPVVVRPFLADDRRCTGSFMLYWRSYDYRIAMCSYLVRLKDSRIVENTPGMPCTVTGLIGWPQATESNSGCHIACRV